MATKKIFISFDWENDRHYRFLLSAWDANGDFSFSFSDQTSNEIKSYDIGRVKAALTAKINNATGTIVIVGKYANTRHKDWLEIGYGNWLDFEIARSKQNGNHLIAVKLNSLYTAPVELIGAGAEWANSFTEEAIVAAVERAYSK